MLRHCPLAHHFPSRFSAFAYSSSALTNIPRSSGLKVEDLRDGRGEYLGVVKLHGNRRSRSQLARQSARNDTTELEGDYELYFREPKMPWRECIENSWGRKGV
jgi:hypothetical protein